MNVPSLTGIRGAAAIWVVLFHLQSVADEFDISWLQGAPVLRTGWAGVDLFFVLSGFILMLVHERDFPRLGWAQLGRFAWLRFFRVYPLATAALLLILAQTLVDTDFRAYFTLGSIPHNFTLSSFIRTLFLATRWWSPADGDWNQPVWSLSVEILGYVAFPFIAVLATHTASRRLLVVLALLCLAFPTFFAHLHNNKIFNDDIFWGAATRMAGAFTGGIVLARLHRLIPDGWRPLQGRLADLGLIGLFVALFLPPYGYALTTFCFGAIVFGLATDRGWANWLFSRPFAVWLGRISFPLYLVHVMALMWVRYNLLLDKAGALERWAALGGYAVFVFCLAWLLHVYVERPAHDFARRSFPGQAAPKPALAEGTANG
jgi:peptidoglycan/LPS O-acetylase OafA/YrhL